MTTKQVKFARQPLHISDESRRVDDILSAFGILNSYHFFSIQSRSKHTYWRHLSRKPERKRSTGSRTIENNFHCSHSTHSSWVEDASLSARLDCADKKAFIRVGCQILWAPSFPHSLRNLVHRSANSINTANSTDWCLSLYEEHIQAGPNYYSLCSVIEMRWVKGRGG